MKRLVIDLDGTLTIDSVVTSYVEKPPNIAVISKLKEYKDAGYEIVIVTARNMRTYEGNVGKINVNTLPVILEWLRRHDVPYDEVHIGKPWCGEEGFYVDDKTIRPSEFVTLTRSQILTLLDSK